MGKRDVLGKALSRISVFAAKRATFKIDSVPFNIVAKTEPAKPDAVLSITRCDAHEFLDGVFSTAVIRVGL